MINETIPVNQLINTSNNQPYMFLQSVGRIIMIQGFRDAELSNFEIF